MRPSMVRNNFWLGAALEYQVVQKLDAFINGWKPGVEQRRSAVAISFIEWRPVRGEEANHLADLVLGRRRRGAQNGGVHEGGAGDGRGDLDVGIQLESILHCVQMTAAGSGAEHGGAVLSFELSIGAGGHQRSHD